MAEPRPLGLTFLLDITRAIVSASSLKTPVGGCVESLVTFFTQRLFGADFLPFLTRDGAAGFFGVLLTEVIRGCDMT